MSERIIKNRMPRINSLIRALCITSLFIAFLAGPLFLWQSQAFAGKDYIVVEVKKGDSLSAIGVKYLKDSSKWREIAEYNNMKNPDLIYIGMKLKIPNRLLKDHLKTGTTPEPPSTATSNLPDLSDVETPGKILYVYKDTMRVSNDGKDEALQAGRLVLTGDKVVTDSLSFCAISLGAGKLIMGPDTRLTVLALDTSGAGGQLRIYLKVQRGFIKVTAPKNSDLRIKSDIAVIRTSGAELTFRVEEEMGNYVDVFYGNVEVFSGAAIKKLSGGKGVIVESKNSISDVVSLPVAPTIKAHQVTDAEGVLHRGAKWEPIPGVTSYRLEVALDSSFEKLVYFTGYAGSSVDFKLLASYPRGRYYIRLISVDKQGLWSEPSNALVFTNSPR